jgi:hypothetical protein
VGDRGQDLGGGQVAGEEVDLLLSHVVALGEQPDAQYRPQPLQQLGERHPADADGQGLPQADVLSERFVPEGGSRGW